MSNPIRVATATISGRIFAGRPTKDGLGFKEPRYDVTGDVLRAIRDMVGVGNEIEVGYPGSTIEFRIAILPPFTPADEGDAVSEGGWVSVPVEPTKAMLDAGDDTEVDGITLLSRGEAIHVWSAMLAAAATAGAPDEDWLTDVLDDSLDMDWTGRVGARAIIAAWEKRNA